MAVGSSIYNHRRAKEKGYYLCNHCLAKADSHGKRVGPPILCGKYH